MKQCKNCKKELTVGRRKYCSDACQIEDYETKRNLEKKALRKENKVVKFCKYEECGKELPKDIHSQKLYCPNTKCSYKQNQLEARRKRAAKNKDKQIVMVRCQNDECEEMLEKHHIRKYCCRPCRNAQNKRDFSERQKLEIALYEIAKENALRSNGSKKNITIDRKFTERYSTNQNTPKPFKIKKMSATWLQNLWDAKCEREKEMA